MSHFAGRQRSHPPPRPEVSRLRVTAAGLALVRLVAEACVIEAVAIFVDGGFGRAILGAL